MVVEFISTLRALTVPRRVLPLALVVVAMLSAEWFATRSATSLAIDLTLLAAFCLLGPASWRLLAAPPRSSRPAATVGYTGFLATNAIAVLLLGYLLPVSLGLDWTYVVEPSSLPVVLVLFLVGAWGLGRDIDLEEGIAAARLRAARLAVEAEQAQLLAIRTHLDPHFLFNTLNAIAEWCREDPEVAETATLELAAILRTVLDGIRTPSWPLSEEISLLRRLFELYRVRDQERYRLTVEMPDTLPQVPVPTLVLLPLFENAVTHGPGAGHDGAIQLRIATREGRVEIQMRNPGRFEGLREGGEGIGIAKRRLALTYDGAARLSVQAEGDETVTTVSIPATRPEEPKA